MPDDFVMGVLADFLSENYEAWLAFAAEREIDEEQASNAIDELQAGRK